MRLDGLRPLYHSMLKQGLDRYQFDYNRGRVTFKVFFFIDEEPFNILFGACGYNLSFEFPVARGFKVSKYPEDIEQKLYQILDLHPNPYNKFSITAFLEEFNRYIPQQAKSQNRIKPHELVVYKTDLQGLNKPYFCGWRDNKICNKTVTLKNLQKTRILLGLKAYELCLKKNISSCWTNDFNRFCEFSFPE